MKIRLYLDEDALDRDLVRALRVRGVDLQTASEAGMIERPDQEHLEYATLRETTMSDSRCIAAETKQNPYA